MNGRNSNEDDLPPDGRCKPKRSSVRKRAGRIVVSFKTLVLKNRLIKATGPMVEDAPYDEDPQPYYWFGHHFDEPEEDQF